MAKLSAEYISAIETFQEAFSASKSQLTEAATALQRAQELYESLKQLRQTQLEEILKNKGLRVCNNPTKHIAKAGTPELVGIFPKSEITLVYRCVWKDIYQEGRKLFKTELICLCPQHKPFYSIDSRDLTTDNYDGWPVEAEILFTATEKDGKYYLANETLEVQIPIQTNYPDAVYRYFGLPELPPQPVSVTATSRIEP